MTETAKLPVRPDGQQTGVKAEVHLTAGGGQPAEQLAKLADRIDADLIVLGSRGHAPLAGVVLGSVTQQLLHTTSRPVLALPPAHAKARRAVRVPAAARYCVTERAGRSSSPARLSCSVAGRASLATSP